MRGSRENGTLMTSVCTGALILRRRRTARRPAGDDALERARLARDSLRRRRRPDARFVDNGKVVTAAGVSAGIDMALHLVARLDSVERARDVRRYIQYDPEPPV